MKILITGASGLLGSELVRDLEKHHHVFYPNSKTLDITDEESVKDYYEQDFEFTQKAFEWLKENKKVWYECWW